MTTTTPEIVQIPLDRLVMNPDFHVRGGIDGEAVGRYAKALKADINLPPVAVVLADPEDQNGGFVLIDGWHRVEAIRKNATAHDAKGLTVTAHVLRGEQEPRRWSWLGAQANLTHGLPLQYRRRREIFRAYVRAGEHRKGGRGSPMKSARCMSRDLGGLATHPTVLKWMRSDFPAVYRAMGEAPEAEDRDHEFPRFDADGSNAKAATGSIDQLLAAFRSIRAQELRDAVLKRAERAVKELKAEPLQDYSSAEAPWADDPLGDDW